MKRDQRLVAVLDLLSEKGSLDVDEIVTVLGVSPATARRDLDTLGEQQLLTRTRGGAIAQSVAYELPIRYRSEHHADEKRRIAAAASALVTRGSIVGLCGGTTSTAVAGALSSRADIVNAADDLGLTVVTNAVNIAAQLAMRPQIKVVVTGGVLHTRSYELVGPFADANGILEQVTMDIAFIGASGIDPVIGPMAQNEGEAAVNSLMARRSARAYIVADSSKVGVRAFAAIGEPHLFRGIITDSGISNAHREALTENGYEVIVVD